MTALHCQVALATVGGEPADVCVNTWTMESINPMSAAEIDAATLALSHFYNTVPAGQAKAVGGYLSEWVSAAANAHTIKAYDATTKLDGGPLNRLGSPVATRLFTITTDAAGSTPLPNEVAASLTLEGFGRSTAAVELSGPDPKERPKTRHTGRVFLGPLNSYAVYPGNPGEDAQPHPTFMAVTLAALGELQTALATIQPNLSVGVWSRANGAIYHLEGAFMDNRFDTIRSRGRRSTVKTHVSF